jgi:death-on-curing protein
VTRYLAVGTLIAINAAQEGGVGVREMDMLEHLAFRPQMEPFGKAAFPDVWSKAAAYAHGIASHQAFFDGNKRTAWRGFRFSSSPHCSHGKTRCVAKTVWEC